MYSALVCCRMLQCLRLTGSVTGDADAVLCVASVCAVCHWWVHMRAHANRGYKLLLRVVDRQSLKLTTVHHILHICYNTLTQFTAKQGPSGCYALLRSWRSSASSYMHYVSYTSAGKLHVYTVTVCRCIYTMLC
jgi:hypothetical protein